jgi:hypothetical protein
MASLNGTLPAEPDGEAHDDPAIATVGLFWLMLRPLRLSFRLARAHHGVGCDAPIYPRVAPLGRINVRVDLTGNGDRIAIALRLS